MTNIIKIPKHNKVGQPTKYDPAKHNDLIVKIFRAGEGVAAFCTEAYISKRTFYLWLEDHPEFKKSYEYALVAGQSYWENIPLINPTIDMRYWQCIMNGRFSANNQRLRLLKNKSAKGKIDAIWEALEEGELSIKDAKTLSDIALTQVHVEDRTPVADSIILPRAELLRQIEAAKTVLDAQKEAA